MSVRRPVMPRPAPPNTTPIWRFDLEGVGMFHINGAVDRDGEKTYLLRVDTPGLNKVAACLVGTDGSVKKWYSSWEKRAGEISEVLELARDFVIAHYVMTG